ncbi:MAG TPA: acyl-CoA dehydrogenase family protein [Myxococcaceae bacterium]|nr:acyl-CoA dehydrogenase family protein [Myxococcaceae bacterium]
MIDQLLADSVVHLLAESCPSRRVRAIESGESPSTLWETILASGFADALVPESTGGGGLGLRGALPVLTACGHFALPLPLAQTMVVRAFLASERKAAPQGPITFARAQEAGAGAMRCTAVPYGRVASWVLVEREEEVVLLPTAAAERTSPGVHGSLEEDLEWKSLPSEAIRLPRGGDWREIGACLFAAHIAGAMGRVFDMTLRHANERVQFGRPIGKFQAIQHQISVMAEHVAAARMAAQLGADSASWRPGTLAAAVAKSRTSEAVPIVAAISHAVHGAIGITAEYDLQLFTRRLHQWRRAFGSESYWNGRIGAELMTATDESALDFVRQRIFGADETR